MLCKSDGIFALIIVILITTLTRKEMCGTLDLERSINDTSIKKFFFLIQIYTKMVVGWS